MWVFDGLPEHIGLNVRDASPLEGGYVVVFELDNAEIRMLATRFPAKFVASWKSQALRYGAQLGLKRVLISRPHVRYEKLKRALVEILAQSEDGKPAPKPTIDLVLKRAEGYFAAMEPKGIALVEGLSGDVPYQEFVAKQEVSSNGIGAS